MSAWGRGRLCPWSSLEDNFYETKVVHLAIIPAGRSFEVHSFPHLVPPPIKLSKVLNNGMNKNVTRKEEILEV